MKLLQPKLSKIAAACMKVQQRCASWWSQGRKDSGMRGLTCRDTTEFPLYPSQMVLRRPSAVSRWHVCVYPLQVQEIPSFAFHGKTALAATVISNVWMCSDTDWKPWI